MSRVPGNGSAVRRCRRATAKHLRVLEDAGIVRSRRSGRENPFEFNPTPVQEPRSYLEHVSAQWDEVLGRLKALVGPRPPGVPAVGDCFKSAYAARSRAALL